MSYILDALKKSDRARQLNTTHSMSSSGLNHVAETKSGNIWKVFAALGLIAVLVLSWLAWQKKSNSDTNVVTTVEMSGQGDIKADEPPADIGLDPVLNDIPEDVSQDTVSLNSVANNVSNLSDVEMEPKQVDSKQDIVEPEIIEPTAADFELNQVENVQAPPDVKERRSLQSMVSTPKPVSNIKPVPVEAEEPEQGLVANLESSTTESSFDDQRYPSYRTMLSQLPGLDNLHLDILAYHTDTDKRSAFINMKKYQEGEQTREGATVLTILERGVIMEYQGNEFLLEPK